MHSLSFYDYSCVKLEKFFFFFFQAEDGIRDLTVTGVQTCALPISFNTGSAGVADPVLKARVLGHRANLHYVAGQPKIGRASCRERGEISGVAGSLKKKKKIKISRIRYNLENLKHNRKTIAMRTRST